MSIDDAISRVGGQAKLAGLIGVSPQMVNQWAKGHRPVSPRCARAIERLTDGAVTAAALRPDVFGEPSQADESVLTT